MVVGCVVDGVGDVGGVVDVGVEAVDQACDDDVDAVRVAVDVVVAVHVVGVDGDGADVGRG